MSKKELTEIPVIAHDTVEIPIEPKKKKFKLYKKRKRISKKVSKGLDRRHRAESRFKIYGFLSVSVSFIFLAVFLYSIVNAGYKAFLQSEINLELNLDESHFVKKNGSKIPLNRVNYKKIINQSLKDRFPEVLERTDVKRLKSLISHSASYDLQKYITDNPEYIGKTINLWLLASSDVDMLRKGRISKDISEKQRTIKDNQIRWIESLESENKIAYSFNTSFFTNGDSQRPEMAGMLGSMIGSILVIIACITASFPLGVLTAVYLEEFAPKNLFTDIIEVNINNLAAVPSIVFGLLGLTVYLQFFDIPRSASLAGGLTLALMVLPVIVIATRTSLKAVPPYIKDGATALGASKVQVSLHHTIPLAMPGIMTGTILSVARALGETAPLLMIGMVAFIVDIPDSFTAPATAMPVQIYLFSDRPELGYVEKTSAAIIVLLVILAGLNMAAAYIRKRFEHKW